MASMEEIEAKQKKMAALGMEMTEVTDTDKLAEMAKKMQEMGKELEKTCKALAASFGTFPEGEEVRVELTADQRARLVEATGVPMELLTVHDRDGTFKASMPTRQKAEIERIAALHMTGKAVSKTRAKSVDKLVKTLEDLNEPSLQETIDLIKKDPSLDELKKKQLADERARKDGA